MNKSIPVFPEFSAVENEYLDEVKEALFKFHPEVCELSTGTLFCYRNTMDVKVTRINGNICFKGFFKNMHFFMEPVGADKIPETFETCLKYLNEKFGGGKVVFVKKETADGLNLTGRFKITPSRDDFDYLYNVNELAALSGKKFHDKKNLLNQFKKNYKFEYKKLCPNVVSECLKLQEEWCNMKKCKENPAFTAESFCIFELFSNFKPLCLSGGVIIIDGKIEAFSVYQRLNKTTAITHVEKGNTKFKGIYQAINYFIANDLLPKYEFVNREEDMGNPGLRKAKLSYNPAKLVEKYCVEIKS